MLGQLHQAGLRGKAQMFTENLDREDDTDGESKEQIQYSTDEDDFSADLSKGISFGVAADIQQDAELQLRNRIRETLASVKHDQKSISEIKKCLFGVKKEKLV